MLIKQFSHTHTHVRIGREQTKLVYSNKRHAHAQMAWEQPWTSDTRTHACNCKWRAAVLRSFFATAVATVAVAAIVVEQTATAQNSLNRTIFPVWPKKKRRRPPKWTNKKLWPKDRIRGIHHKGRAKTKTNAYTHTQRTQCEKYLYHSKWLCWSFRQMKTIILNGGKNVCENEFPLNLNLSHTHKREHTAD